MHSKLTSAYICYRAHTPKFVCHNFILFYFIYISRRKRLNYVENSMPRTETQKEEKKKTKHCSDRCANANCTVTYADIYISFLKCQIKKNI